MEKALNGLCYAALLFFSSLLLLGCAAVLFLLVNQMPTPLAGALAGLVVLCLSVGFTIAVVE